MRIDKISTTPFSLPLTRSMKWGSSQYNFREGILLELETETGKRVQSEISPLPFYSSESLSDAREQMANLRIPLKQITFEQDRWHTQLQELFIRENITPYPSILFGIETALHSLFFGEFDGPEPEMQGLLLGSREEILKQISASDPVSTMKLKVFGLSDLNEAIATTKEVLEILPDSCTLRVDINRRWNEDEALAFGKAFYPNTFEYIEEPMKEFSMLKKFHEVTGHSVAVDDSLRSEPLFEVLSSEFIKGFVLKPTLLGGMQFTLGVAQMVHNRGGSAVLSSSLESEVGMRHLKKMAQMMPNTSTPVGLDTLKLFEHDLALSHC